MQVHLALVVGGAASVDPSVLDARLERWSHPQIEGIDRLDVVVAVDDDRGRALRMQPIGVDHRVAAGGGDVDVLEADLADALRRSTRRPGACRRGAR